MNEIVGKKELLEVMDKYKEMCLMATIEGALLGDTERINDAMEALTLIETVCGHITKLCDAFDELDAKLNEMWGTQKD